MRPYNLRLNLLKSIMPSLHFILILGIFVELKSISTENNDKNIFSYQLAIKVIMVNLRIGFDIGL